MVKIDNVIAICLILISLLFGVLIGALRENASTDIKLSQETGDKICLDLTNESGVIAKDYEDFGEENNPIKKGELYCQIPSYDETHLIKVGN